MELKSFVELIGGLVLLLGAGHFLVLGSVCLARRLNVSTLVVGLTVVSLGTSAPELLVSLNAVITGHPDIAIGNVVGSNISNIGLVLGITSLIFPLAVRSSSIKFDWPVMMASGLLLYWFGLDGQFNRQEGMIFLIVLASYIFYSLAKSRKNEALVPKIPIEFKMSYTITILVILLSTLGLMFGAKFLVLGATDIARFFNVSERAISVSLIAVGTSLPELVTSVAAAIKKESDISIGNIIGSNIYNTFGILGVTGIVKPIDLGEKIMGEDLYWMMGFFVLLFLLILPLKGGVITRLKGVILILLYGLYIYTVFKP